MPRRAVNASQPIPITTALNISALARAAGVSRKTIVRRLAKGWRPDAHTPMPTPRTPAHAHHESHGRARAGKAKDVPIVRMVPPPESHVRPPLGVVRTVLLLLAVGFYVLIACAAVGVRG